MNKYLAAVAVLCTTLTQPAWAAITIPAANFETEKCQPARLPSADKQASGTVAMEVLVEADGHAGKVEIIKSSGDQKLDQASLAAAGKCQYTPASVDGAAVSNWLPVKHEWKAGRAMFVPAIQLPLETCTKPVWPKEALRKGYQGTVTLFFLIGEDGAVRESRVDKSSAYSILDQAAQEGIARCKFDPAIVKGKPAAAWLRMQYVWVLEDTTPEEIAAALAQARSGAERGEAAGQFELGKIYLMGHGVPADETEGIKWIKKAAIQGLASAEDSMGLITAGTFDKPGDLELAMVWFRKAADQGLASSQFYLGALLFRLDEFEEGSIWLRKAAQQDHAGAQGFVARALLDGGQQADLPEAIALLRKASAQDDLMAQVTLAHCHETGRGVPQDYAKAVALYRTAAAAGDSDGQLGLARLYEAGHGVPQNTAKAQELRRLAQKPAPAIK